MVGPSLNSPKPPTTTATTTTIKFLCSYGGRILPRYPDGKLRYHGGHTRVLSVPRSISFSELMAKLAELCGKTASLRCQLPTEDLDALVTITSDEELENLVEEYDRPLSNTAQSSTTTSPVKIRAFLWIPKKPSSPGGSVTRTPSSVSASGSGSGSSSSSTDSPMVLSPKSPSPSLSGFCTSDDKMTGTTISYTSSKPPVGHNYKAPGNGKIPCRSYRNGYNRFCAAAPNGNYWQ